MLKQNYLIKNINLFLIFFVIFFFFQVNKSLGDDLKKLRNLYKEGLITEKELKKAISLIENKNNNFDEKIEIRKLRNDASGTKFEKLEFYLDNYRVYTLSPGIIYFDNLRTGKTDVKLKNNFKVEMNSEGKKLFNFEYDEKNLSSKLMYKGKMIINWTGKYVQRHQATFYQMTVLGYKPFHFYIRIHGKKVIALNVDFFTDKIDRAVEKAKEKIALKYNLTIDDIDRIIDQKDKIYENQVEKVISQEQEKLIKEMTEKYVGQEITAEIRKEIEETIGQEMAEAFIDAVEYMSGQAIDQAIEDEIAREIDAAINTAVQEGISQAVAEAAIYAMLVVYALGGTDADAMDACRAIAGDAC